MTCNSFSVVRCVTVYKGEASSESKHLSRNNGCYVKHFKRERSILFSNSIWENIFFYLKPNLICTFVSLRFIRAIFNFLIFTYFHLNSYWKIKAFVAAKMNVVLLASVEQYCAGSAQFLARVITMVMVTSYRRQHNHNGLLSKSDLVGKSLKAA